MDRNATEPPGQLDEALRMLGLAMVNNEELKTENRALRANLERCLHQPAHHHTAQSTDAETCGRHSHGTDSDITPSDRPGDYHSLLKDHRELTRLYQNLQTEHAKCQKHIKKANGKYAEAKTRIQQWQAYIDKQKQRKMATTGDPNEVPHPTPERTCSRSVSSAAAGDSDGALPPVPPTVAIRTPTLSRVQSANSEGEELPTGPGSDTPRAGVLSSPAGRYRRITSSQTTEGEPEPTQQLQRTGIKRELASDDEPVIVSERVVKRPRDGSSAIMPPPRRIKLEGGSPEEPVQLRSEEFSSPVHSKHALVRRETSDLDTAPALLGTPRRRRLQSGATLRAVSEEVERRNPPLARILRRDASSLSDGDLAELTEGSRALAPDVTTGGTGDSVHKGLPGQPGDVLRPMSVNITSMPRQLKVNLNASAQRKRQRDLALLSEDGDDNSSQVAPRPGGVSEVAPKPALGGRLGAMLDGRTPQRQPLSRPIAPATVTPAMRKTAVQPKQPKSAPGGMQRTTRRPLVYENSPPPVRPEDEPLRLRPLSSLAQEDFRVNPKFQGTAFAFTDSLRGRDAQRCMPGCTKPECCGDTFRRMINIGGTVVSGKTDNEALEDYLGPDFAVVMGAFTPEKRKETILQAHTFALACKHGKHKQAFERRSTPPGFWRTDMPSTQEQEEDRRQADENGRRKVEERWREAMREGGRYVFRDEL